MSLAKYFESTNRQSTLKFIKRGKFMEDNKIKRIQYSCRITAELQDRAWLCLTLFRIF